MKKNYLLFFVVFFINLILIILLFPKAGSLLKKIEENNKYNDMTIFAVGDSLTQGVGDENGGYLFYLKSNLKSDLNIESIKISNYGVSGNTSVQIINRINNDEQLKKDLKEADIITITVGGNDLMKVFKENILTGVNEKTFMKPSEEYILNLEKLYSLLRKYNSSAVIYQLGIYNPFFNNFQDLKEMQKVVDDWNLASEKFVNNQENAYFININDHIYNDALSEGDTNIYLSDDDFHPNGLGYEIISREFQKKITEYISGDKW